MTRSYLKITADFPGAATPVGSVIRFRSGDKTHTEGKVTAIRTRHLEVAGHDGDNWSVPYPAIDNIVSTPPVECSLSDVESLGENLTKIHLAGDATSGQWTFGFDLAPSRAGVCRFNERRINLSVSYCLSATRADIHDTILHEIAHALVGPLHNHDRVWKAKAREIGCTGDRCHRVQHTVPKWVGECGCGQQWFRQKLQRRMMSNRVCAKCMGAIKWRQHKETD